MKVTVAVPGSVDDNLAGSELGLSFCPGAVRLP